MPCIEMPEVAYLYGYLLVSARVYTSDSTPTSCRSDTRDSSFRLAFGLIDTALIHPHFLEKRSGSYNITQSFSLSYLTKTSVSL